MIYYGGWIYRDKKVAFLLGAGCEGRGQLELPSGPHFKHDCILANGVANLANKINEGNTRKIKNGSIIAHNSWNILYQTIVENPEALHFNDADNKIIEDFWRLQTGDGTFSDAEKDEIRTGFKTIYKEQFYSKIKDTNTDYNSLDANVKKFLDNASFFSFIDSLFNYLRRPEKYQSEVNRVMKLYYAAFLSVFRGLINDDLSDEYKEMLGAKSSVAETRQKLKELISVSQKRIVDSRRDDNGLYYNQIRDFNKDSVSCRIVTTNYTCFAEQLSGISGNDIAYVHGRLDMFEDLKTKRAGSLDSFSDQDFVFPFIFVQSGVKPIVNSYQIHEFEKATRMIVDSDILVILGYGINSDDEHLSNIIRERIRSKKRTKCFIYGIDDEKRRNVCEELNDDGIIEFHDSSEFKDVLSSIK